MQATAATVDSYLGHLPEDRQQAMKALRKVIKSNIPKGFKEEINYGMIGYVVPHSKYPAGYHCKPTDPLPFLNIASQKNFVAVYHMGIYSDPKLLQWFMDKYAKLGIGKPDMGKGCIRFKKLDKIPFELIGELSAKITPDGWIAVYEKNLKQR